MAFMRVMCWLTLSMTLAFATLGQAFAIPHGAVKAVFSGRARRVIVGSDLHVLHDFNGVKLAPHLTGTTAHTHLSPSTIPTSFPESVLPNSTYEIPKNWTVANLTCNDTGSLGPEDFDILPLCDSPTANETAKALKNKLVQQCLVEKETGELSVGDCGRTVPVRFCVDPCGLGVRTVTGQCLGVADPRDVLIKEARLSLVPCDFALQGKWVLGNLDGLRLVNNQTGFCADVAHQHRNGPVIQWPCKGVNGYRPDNQAWLWNLPERHGAEVDHQ